MTHAAHQAILDSLPPRRRRSKLEPYAALIRALRTRGRSYREIVTILRERCGLSVATHTLFHFVRTRARHTGDSRPRRRQSSRDVRPSAPIGPSPAARAPDGPEDVWARIVAAKRRAPTRASAAEPKAFAYDETEPLQLIPDTKPREG